MRPIWQWTIHLDMNNYKGYKDLDCYKQARELRIFVSTLVQQFPKEEKYLLVSQSKRSSRSITANIAEGYGRYTYTDTRNFFIVARGSVTETMEHLSTAFDEQYITNDDLNKANELCENCFKLINGFIAYLDKSKAERKTTNSPIPNS